MSRHIVSHFATLRDHHGIMASMHQQNAGTDEWKVLLIIIRRASSLNMSSTGIRFARAVLMVRGAEGVSRGVDFYHNALGLAVVRHTDEFAELTCNKAFSINLLAVDSEAQLCTAYSPSLTFEVDQLDVIIPKCIQMGAHLDGGILHPAHGKVASLRTPDGHMIGLYEPSIM